MSVIDRIVGRLRGHRLSVLGERGVGKTHLQQFLREGQIPTTYVQTLGQPSLRPGRAHLVTVDSIEGHTSKVKVAIKAGYDVPGAAEAVDAWRESIGQASILLYLFRADSVYGEDEMHLRRIRDDARVIADLVHDRGHKLQHVALVGTHYDEVPGYQGPQTGSKFYNWHQLIESNTTIDIARSILGESTPEPALVVGSMETPAATQELTFRLFAQELKL